MIDLAPCRCGRQPDFARDNLQSLVVCRCGETTGWLDCSLSEAFRVWNQRMDAQCQPPPS